MCYGYQQDTHVLKCPRGFGCRALTPRPLAQIIDNFLNGNGDDLIAIQGTYLLVIAFDASQKAVTVATGNPLGCAPRGMPAAVVCRAWLQDSFALKVNESSAHRNEYAAGRRTARAFLYSKAEV